MSVLEQAVSLGPFMGKLVAFAQITGRTSKNNIAHIISPSTREGYYMLNMVSACVIFYLNPTIVAFALLICILLLNIVKGIIPLRSLTASMTIAHTYTTMLIPALSLCPTLPSFSKDFRMFFSELVVSLKNAFPIGLIPLLAALLLFFLMFIIIVFSTLVCFSFYFWFGKATLANLSSTNLTVGSQAIFPLWAFMKKSNWLTLLTHRASQMAWNHIFKWMLFHLSVSKAIMFFLTYFASRSQSVISVRCSMKKLSSSKINLIARITSFISFRGSIFRKANNFRWSTTNNTSASKAIFLVFVTMKVLSRKRFFLLTFGTMFLRYNRFHSKAPNFAITPWDVSSIARATPFLVFLLYHKSA